MLQLLRSLEQPKKYENILCTKVCKEYKVWINIHLCTGNLVNRCLLYLVLNTENLVLDVTNQLQLIHQILREGGGQGGGGKDTLIFL